MTIMRALITEISRLDERSTLPQPWNPKQIDPALLTYEEYYRIANDEDKFHPSEAYQTTLSKLNGPERSYLERSRFPHLLKRVKIRGMYFEFRLKAEKRVYNKTDSEGKILRDSNGNALEMTDAEVAAAGRRPYEYTIGIYDEDSLCCGAAQDEWGCVLIWVADEYRGFGLGPILGRIARTYEPGKPSGGFTPAGYRNFAKLHREMVRDALTTGRYMDLIRQGKLTVQRVREIVDSAKLQMKPMKPAGNLSSKDPKDWLLYQDDGCWVVYDRKLREVVEQGGDDVWHWAERMIKGYLLVRIPNEYGIVVRFGADTDGLKRFLLTLGAGWCQQEGIPFAVDEEDISYVDPKRFEIGPVHVRSGMRRADVSLKREPIDPRGMALAERAFRKSFDRYGEFKQWVLELADAKFRPEPPLEKPDYRYG